jgi:hypothetical protein
MADIFDQMAEKWPSSIVSRQEFKTFSGGAVSPKYLANCDSNGTGIEGRFKIGKKTVYPVDNSITWLRKRASNR